MKAPFTPEQVVLLNQFQNLGTVHPFTCKCGENLIATENGWICDKCDYTQDWAHDFMADKKFIESMDIWGKLKKES